MTTRGHSNVRLENITAHKNTGAAMIPIEGGANINTVRPLPTLALRREEWKQIGDRMNWFASPPNTNGGVLWIEFHDRGGHVRRRERMAQVVCVAAQDAGAGTTRRMTAGHDNES